MQVLAVSVGDAATKRPALDIVAMNVLLSIGTISLAFWWMFAQCGQLGALTECEG
jgi:hypothetical protein